MNNLHLIFEQLETLQPVGRLLPLQIQDLLENLPRLTEKELVSSGHRDSLCPICLTPYLALLAEEESALAMESPAHPVEELGVTKLSQSWQCGHLFCRRDISRWIQTGKDSCPICRRVMVTATPTSSDPEITGTITEGLTGLRESLEQFQVEFESNERIMTDLRAAFPPDEDDRQGFSGMYS